MATTWTRLERRCRTLSAAKQLVQQNQSPHRGQKRTSPSRRPHSWQRLMVDIKAPEDRIQSPPTTFFYAKGTCKHRADRFTRFTPLTRRKTVCSGNPEKFAGRPRAGPLFWSAAASSVRAITIESRSINNMVFDACVAKNENVFACYSRFR
jgi:hypothetical protein